ncbi:hypothetical protein PHJA_002470700 [Phtheirospermum japonicum]|uniref:Uncharacterized protein n=1 Tax=Phtheirospermum japonicum TaxID=374723 RepID=A0A830D0C2_9LAMI|nr:hypothetical protein PHJA_002470700 [Phtheirospermum japonicum]
MEGLEKLEQVQNTINLMHSAGVSDASPDCERFLVAFTFLLMQPCGELDITLKCKLISKHMPKITSLFSENALPCGGEGFSQIGNALQIYCDGERNIFPVLSFHDDIAMVGIDAMMRSNSTLEDFLDGLNEKLLQMAVDGDPISTMGVEDDKPGLGAKCVRMFQKDPFRPLLSVLQRHGLLTERITEELRYGEEYWALERKLCCALESNKESAPIC